MKGQTGNPVVDLYHGRELQPALLGCSLKLQAFRVSMVGLAVLNTVLVAATPSPGPALLAAAAMQVQ